MTDEQLADLIAGPSVPAIGLSPGLHALCAAAYAALAIVVLLQRRPGATTLVLAAASVATVAWAAVTAAVPGRGFDGSLGDLGIVRTLAWYCFLLHLYRRAVPSPRALPLFVTVGATVLVAALLLPPAGTDPSQEVALRSAHILIRLALAVCSILLIENVWFNVAAEDRWHVNLPCVALGLLATYDLVVAADAMLFHRMSVTLLNGRAVACIVAAPLLGATARRSGAWTRRLEVSRSAAFHTATLVVAGIFLLGLAGIGEGMRAFGEALGIGDWGDVMQIGLLFTGLAGIGVMVTSGSTRSRISRVLVDNLFQHRYDYRREWLRTAQLLSSAEAYVPLHRRAIRALADVVDSPGGQLYLRDAGEAAFQWAGSCNMAASALTIGPDHPLLPAFRDAGWVATLLPRPGHAADCTLVPDDGLDGLWLAVPLTQPLPEGLRLCGFVLLAPPRAPFVLDSEVFDLLRTVGQEVASHLAEQQAVRGLMQARQLDEYGRRFAFVAHDIKNVSSQLSLLLSNAEVHLSNPEFQRDMLATVRASVDKITALLRRLSEPADAAAASVIEPAERLDAVLATLRRAHERAGGDGVLVLEQDCRHGGVAMDPAAFDAVVTHIVTNAIEAADGSGPVQVRIRHDARRVLIEVTDRGPGMTAEFVRDKLFRPFDTSKRGGSGIGAFQARELLREAGGDLLVDSRPGHGTTMRLLLPLVEDATARPSATIRPIDGHQTTTEAA